MRLILSNNIFNTIISVADIAAKLLTLYVVAHFVIKFW